MGTVVNISRLSFGDIPYLGLGTQFIEVKCKQKENIKFQEACTGHTGSPLMANFVSERISFLADHQKN